MHFLSLQWHFSFKETLSIKLLTNNRVRKEKIVSYSLNLFDSELLPLLCRSVCFKCKCKLLYQKRWFIEYLTTFTTTHHKHFWDSLLTLVISVKVFHKDVFVFFFLLSCLKHLLTILHVLMIFSFYFSDERQEDIFTSLNLRYWLKSWTIMIILTFLFWEVRNHF